MEKIEILGYITSSNDENESDDDDRNSSMFNLESPVVKFPEKIKMNKGYADHVNKTASNIKLPIPKLDLTEVKAKYHAAKNVEIAEVFNKNSNRSSSEYIEKLRFQLKICKNTILIMKRKILKFKRIFQVQKQTITSLKTKNELVDSQVKRSAGSTNDDTRGNKKDMNTSMVTNTYIILSYVE
jgi:hypothetical protein